MADSFVKLYVFPHLRISTLGRTTLRSTLKQETLQSLVCPSHESSILNHERMQVPAAYCFNTYSNYISQLNILYGSDQQNICLPSPLSTLWLAAEHLNRTTELWCFSICKCITCKQGLQCAWVL